MGALMSTLLLLSIASADEAGAEDEDHDEEVIVEGERPRETASEVVLDRARIEVFPATSADDLLEAMPGLHQSAHGGHGKAYQYFVRGFDAVHGTDLAVYLEGIPLNEVSNIHGHGYLDLHFIPEVLVQGLSLHKGSSRAEDGDFAVAASAEYALGLAEEGLLGRVGGGTDRSGELLLAWRPRGGTSGDFLVAEAEAGAGAGEHRGWRQVRLAGGRQRWFGGTRGRVFALAYHGEFESPGVLRVDDIEEGTEDFWGAYDEAGDGVSSRLLLGAELLRPAVRHGWSMQAWSGVRALALTRNFTGYAYDAEHGDGVRQAQQGITFGWRGQGYRDLGREPGKHHLRGGLFFRGDGADQEEQGVEPDGTAWEQRIDATFQQGDLGAWLSLDSRPVPWLEVEPGLRGELLGVHLVRHIDDDGEVLASPESARSWAPVLAPKARLVVLPESRARIFASYGRGFRSPEARGIEDGDRAPVTVSDTEELGVRWAPGPHASFTGVAFHTTISNELVFDHAAARFLASGATRRVGGEALAEVEPTDWLRSELEVTWADGRYVDSGEALPYAPRWLGSLGLYGRGEAAAGLQWSSGLRGWFLGPRPLPEGFYSQPTFVVDATANGTWNDWVFRLEVDNLLGTKWRDGEFVYSSWFHRDEPRSELPALHVTAGDPFAVRLAVGRRFP